MKTMHIDSNGELIRWVVDSRVIAQREVITFGHSQWGVNDMVGDGHVKKNITVKRSNLLKDTVYVCLYVCLWYSVVHCNVT